MLKKETMSNASDQTSNQTPRTGSKRLLWFLLIPLVLCIGGAFTLLARSRASKALAATTQASAAEPVNVIHAKMGDVNAELVLPATLQPFDESSIYARTSGYVSHWYANIGDHVRQGELLATIDSPEVDHQLIQDRAALSQAQAALALATVTTKRYLELIKSNSVAQEEVDQNTQNLEAQRANVQATTAQVAQLEQEQSYEKVVAPFDGVITSRRTDLGDLINAGNNGAGAELFRVSKVSTMRIFVSVPEAYSEQIKNGMAVKVELTELPGQVFGGRVTRSTDAINVQTRTLLVEVDVPNAQAKLLPGAYGEVHFTLPSPTRPVVVPTGAILFQAAGPQVAVVNSKQQIELRKVLLGRDLGTTMEITGGITSADSVVANPPDYLVDGMQVSVQNTSDGKQS
jgi:RND family efflux transporter MFP subunit